MEPVSRRNARSGSPSVRDTPLPTYPHMDQQSESADAGATLWNFNMAAIQLQDAIHFRRTPPMSTLKQLRFYQLYRSVPFRLMYHSILVMHMLLATIEYPFPEEGSRAFMLNSCRVCFHHRFAAGLEIVFLFFHFAYFLVNWRIMVPHRDPKVRAENKKKSAGGAPLWRFWWGFWHEKFDKRNMLPTVERRGVYFRAFVSQPSIGLPLVACAALFLEAFVVVLMPTPSFRVMRFVRPVVLIAPKGFIRTNSTIIGRSLKSVVSIGWLMCVWAFMYSLYASMLFSKIDHDPYFGDIWEGWKHLVVLITTTNYPDVMLPAYEIRFANFFFFFAFLLVAHYILLQMLTAVIFAYYRKTLSRNVQRRLRYYHVQVSESFTWIAHEAKREDGSLERRVSLSQWTMLMTTLEPSWKRRDVEELFKRLDHDESGFLTLMEWIRVPLEIDVHTLAIKCRRRDQQSKWWRALIAGKKTPKTIFQRIYVSKLSIWLVGWVNPNRSELTNSGSLSDMPIQGRLELEKVKESHLGMDAYPPTAFDWVMYFIIIANVGITTAAVQLDTMGRSADASALERVERWFTLVFCLEIGLRMYAHGWVGFWAQNWFRYDAFVAVVNLILWISSTLSSADLLSYVAMFRLLRCVRVVLRLRTFRRILSSVIFLAPMLLAGSIMIYSVMYIYALFGMGVFRGVLVGHDLHDLDYGKLNYFQLNFDTFSTSMVTLFATLFGNNYHIIMEAYVAKTSQGAVLYFFSFYFLTTLIITNLILSFFVEAYGRCRSGFDSKREDIDTQGSALFSIVCRKDPISALLDSEAWINPATGVVGSASHIVMRTFPEAFEDMLRQQFVWYHDYQEKMLARKREREELIHMDDETKEKCKRELAKTFKLRQTKWRHQQMLESLVERATGSFEDNIPRLGH